jgi:hypothetical protein
MIVYKKDLYKCTSITVYFRYCSSASRRYTASTPAPLRGRTFMPSFSAAVTVDPPKQRAGKAERSREGKCPAKAETAEGLAKTSHGNLETSR